MGLFRLGVGMVDSIPIIHEDDLAPSVSVERRRRSLALCISSLLIVDGLCRKGSLYRKLPMEPLKLSVLKLDGSCFDIEVEKTATVAELKQAVEAVFGQKGPCKISWSHLWGHFCLCYNGQKLVTQTDSIRNYGIKDGDQLKFVRHIAIGYNLRKRRAKKRVVGSKQKLSAMQANSCDEGETRDEKDSDCGDIEKGEVLRYNKKDRRLIQYRKSRMAGLLGGWYLNARLSTIRRRKIVGLACPAGIATGLVGGFRKIIWLCRRKPSSGRIHGERIDASA
ncbi:hypothetical protein F2P56_017506 [Juglans regia]|uniref:SNRNP25 ubiquitin-like domain-containing protein n=2 Tax=Juglans regia TaxID=51240 RepID=A0A833UEL4_JUGRE|nr:U11/U12 small nuclear ribonucleoprotein 25 kDa protein-like [Juglans regia]KAF5461402.1 hypothetical protein F2P56_017506 [Juglans regia]